jgi:hypothetical protein
MKAKTVKAMAKGRSIHLIDIENLCREPNPTEAHVSQAKAAYFAKVQPGDQDLFYVTVSSRNNVAAAVFGWGNASFSCKEGHDGADILLAQLMLDGDLGSRFEKVYLASGDGGLAPFASALIKQGVELEVVAVPDALSFQYRLIGANVSYLWLDFGLAA